MQKIIGFLLLLFIMITACAEKASQKEAKAEPAERSAIPQKVYPPALQEMLDVHGGIDLWRSLRGLVFEIPRADHDEIHTVDLYSRQDRVDTQEYSMGFDGTDVWLLDENSRYEGDPVFYHNLMFYFFAMPFVLADEGIVYDETEDLVFKDSYYPGIRISYQTGVGTSPKDEYFVHYDPETHQMAWLGYTVTYRTGEKSDEIKWLRYKSWQEVNGIFLPDTITWYHYEGRKLLEPKSSISFRNVELSKKPRSVDFYKKPEQAGIFKAQEAE